MRRQIIFVIVSVVVSAIFLVLVLRDVPLAEVAESIRQANILWVFASWLTVLLALWTRAVRWRGLLGNQISPRDSFYLIGITFLLNQLPLRAGEVARSLFATRHGISFMTAATSIVVERLLDVLIVVLLIAGAVTQLPDVPPEVTRGAVLFGVAGVIGFAVLIFFAHSPGVADRLLAIILRIFPPLNRLPLAEWLHQVIEGLHPLTNWRVFAHAVLWTLIGWAVSLLSLYTLLLALNLSEHLWLVAVLGVCLASLSIAIPISVAALGLFESAIKITGDITGMNDITSTALGFLFHGVTVLGYVTIGIVGMIGMGISLNELFKGKSGTE